MLALQPSQHVAAVLATSQRVAQLGVELVEDRGLVEKQLHCFRQAGNNILSQIIGDIAFGSRQPGEKTCAIPLARQGQSRQVQRGDPTFRARIQLIELTFFKRKTFDVAQIRSRFRPSQTQILGLEPERPGAEGRWLFENAVDNAC